MSYLAQRYYKNVETSSHVGSIAEVTEWIASHVRTDMREYVYVIEYKIRGERRQSGDRRKS